MPNYDSLRFRCPYCFGSMTHRDVLFRANTGFTREELEQYESETPMRDPERLIRPLFLRYDAQDSFTPNKKLDEKLIAFWEKRGGSSGYVNADPNWDYPHIDPKSSHFFKMVLTGEAGGVQADVDGFVRDRELFITRVIDRYSDPSIPVVRLCPHCHNPLPLFNYGKFPLFFIGVAGLTGSGKTVYLHQLLTHFPMVLQNTDYQISANALSIQEVIRENQPLPGATDTAVMRRPLAVSITHKHNPTKGMTLVFYDIAGENCTNDSQSHIMGQFMAYCNALMLVISPEEIPFFSAGNTLRAQELQNVIHSIVNIRYAQNNLVSSWNTIPVSVVLTKSDLLREKLPADSPIFALPDPEQGFDQDAFQQIDDALSRLLRENAREVSAGLDVFSKKAFFAVSAITCGVQDRFEKYQNTYCLSFENSRKFRKLIDWADAWKKRSPQERKHFYSCPILDREGNTIPFDLETELGEETASIATEICAECVQDGVVDHLNLNFWEIISRSIDLISYPLAPPNPRRIEDPVRWILSEFEKDFASPTPLSPLQAAVDRARGAVIRFIYRLRAYFARFSAPLSTSQPAALTDGPYVFISHRSEDWKKAEQIKDILERNGISCWIDSRDLSSFGNFGPPIISAIQNASYLLLLLTPSALAHSQYIVRELSLALDANKPMSVITTVGRTDLEKDPRYRDFQFYLINQPFIPMLSRAAFREDSPEMQRIIHDLRAEICPE